MGNSSMDRFYMLMVVNISVVLLTERKVEQMDSLPIVMVISL